MRTVTVDGLLRAVSRIAMVGAVGGLASACSSDAMRFTDNPFSNPFASAANAAEPSMTGSVAKPSKPAAPATKPVAKAEPIRAASLPAPAKVAMATAPRSAPSAGGWTAEGGTALTVKPGDTVATISDRYGVPAAAILSVNGLTGAQVTAGRRIIIPVYSTSARTSAAPSPAAKPVAAAAPAKVAAKPAAPAPKTIAEAASAPRAAAAKATTAAKPATGAKPEPVRVAVKAPEPKRVAFVEPKTTGSVEAKAVKPAAAATPAKSVKPEVAKPTPAKPAPAATKATAPAKPGKGVEPVKSAGAAKPAPEPAKEPETTAATTPAAPPAEFRWPARGRVIAGFGGTGGNEGVNIAVPEGTPVKAAEAGTVAYAGNEVKGYGNLVLIKHDNGYVSAYAHTGDMDVKRGQRVTRGQVIAKSGQTGNVTSPQLHFEIRKGSTPVDPMRYLASN